MKIGGTGSALGSMELLGAAFEQSHPGIKVLIVPSLGSSGGIKAVAQGAIDIGVISRPLNDKELKLGLSVTDYAKTPLVFVTSSNVTKSDLSTEELIQILRGEILNWPDGRRIRLILRPAGDSQTLIIKSLSPEISQAMDYAFSRNGMLISPTTQENSILLEKAPGGFGFSTLSQLMTEKHTLNILSYNGVTPSLKTLAGGTYPVFESLKIITQPAPSAAVRRFIDFVRSAKGKKILEKSGNLTIIR